MENLRTDYAVLVKEVIDVLIVLIKKGITLPAEFVADVKKEIEAKFAQILESPKENQLVNKDLIDSIEQLLNLF